LQRKPADLRAWEDKLARLAGSSTGAELRAAEREYAQQLDELHAARGAADRAAAEASQLAAAEAQREALAQRAADEAAMRAQLECEIVAARRDVPGLLISVSGSYHPELSCVLTSGLGGLRGWSQDAVYEILVDRWGRRAYGQNFAVIHVSKYGHDHDPSLERLILILAAAAY